jgi:hypothetical protein
LKIKINQYEVNLYIVPATVVDPKEGSGGLNITSLFSKKKSLKYLKVKVFKSNFRVHPLTPVVENLN